LANTSWNLTLCSFGPPPPIKRVKLFSAPVIDFETEARAVRVAATESPFIATQVLRSFW
jgi:hypothetical protein